MALQVGPVTTVRDVEVELPIDRVFETPPFTQWAESRYSRDRLEDAVRRIRPEVVSAIEPRAMYRVLPTEETDLSRFDPPEPLLEAGYVGTMVVTVGQSESPESDSKHLFDAMIRDALENVALTVVKERLATDIRREANEAGWNTTRLFSPGSGNVDWPVENTAFVFETLPAADIGVEITDHGLLVPNKSISTVVGMGPTIAQAPDLFTCVGCPRIPDCPYAVV